MNGDMTKNRKKRQSRESEKSHKICFLTLRAIESRAVRSLKNNSCYVVTVMLTQNWSGRDVICKTNFKLEWFKLLRALFLVHILLRSTGIKGTQVLLTQQLGYPQDPQGFCYQKFVSSCQVREKSVSPEGCLGDVCLICEKSHGPYLTARESRKCRLFIYPERKKYGVL